MQSAPARKIYRLVAHCPEAVHAEFLNLADRTGESGSAILRQLVGEAIERGRRGEPIVRGLMAGARAVNVGG